VVDDADCVVRGDPLRAIVTQGERHNGRADEALKINWMSRRSIWHKPLHTGAAFEEYGEPALVQWRE